MHIQGPKPAASAGIQAQISPRDATSSPRDAASSPRDVASSPRDLKAQDGQAAQVSQAAQSGVAAEASEAAASQEAPSPLAAVAERLTTGFESLAKGASTLLAKAGASGLQGQLQDWGKNIRTQGQTSGPTSAQGQTPAQGDGALTGQLRQKLSLSHLPAQPRTAEALPQAQASGFRPVGGVATNALQARATASLEGGQSVGQGGAGTVGARFYNDSATAPRTAEVLRQSIPATSSREDRMRFIDGQTQMDSRYDEGVNGNGCGAACIVNGAFVQGGQRGLQDLMRVIDERGNNGVQQSVTQGQITGSIPEWDQLSGIRQRIDQGTVSRQDLSTLQSIVHQQLRGMEHSRNSSDRTESINVNVMRDYLNTDVQWIGVDRPLQNHFRDMNIKLIDTDGDNSGNHYVLFFNSQGRGGEDRVFDPWPHRDGHQVVSGGDMSIYHANVRNAVR